LTTGVIVSGVPSILQTGKRRDELLHGRRKPVSVLFKVSPAGVVVKPAPNPVPSVFQQRIVRRPDQTVGVAVCQGVEYSVVRRAHCSS
jgi:hypothetical protein